MSLAKTKVGLYSKHAPWSSSQRVDHRVHWQQANASSPVRLELASTHWEMRPVTTTAATTGPRLLLATDIATRPRLLLAANIATRHRLQLVNVMKQWMITNRTLV